jgi:hypothetical protein
MPPFPEFMPIRAQVNLAATSGIREEDVVNTWAFAIAESGGTILAPLSTVVGQLTTFYNAVGDRLQGTISRAACTVKLYDLREARPQVPIFDGSLGFTTAANSGEAMPAEAAICVSFQGVRESGKVQARRRGRVYIGPVTSANTGSHARPNSADINDLVAAAQALIDASQASSTWKWCIFSPTNAGGFYEPGGSGPPYFGGDAMVVVDNGWVDNAWDTQRRRGLSPTARTTFS